MVISEEILKKFSGAIDSERIDKQQDLLEKCNTRELYIIMGMIAERLYEMGE